MVDVAQPEIHDEAAPAETTGQPVGVTEAGTGFTLFTDRAVVAMRVDGELKDLAADVAPGEVVEPVRIDSPDGLSILRHSAAHVMAQAVQQINPEAKLGIGPPLTDGFYFDFDVAEPFTPEDLKAIAKNMERIVRQGQRFTRRVVTEEEARELMADEPYKLELIGLKGGSSEELGEDGESVEVGGAELTVYENVDGKTGEVFWRDLCRGPHLPSTRMVGNGWALSRVAAAYWRGSEKNPQLQRIYGTAWPTKDELRAYQGRIEEALKRDTAASAPSSTSSPSPTRSGPGSRSSTPRAASSGARWRTTRVVGTRRPATSSSTRRTSRSRTYSRRAATSTSTRTACSPPCTSTRRGTTRARSRARARTTT